MLRFGSFIVGVLLVATAGWAAASAPPALAPTAGGAVNDEYGRAWTFEWYAPPRARSTPRIPLVMALHGCNETPPDFEDGTRWFEDAQANNYIVVMPKHITGGYGGPLDINTYNCWQYWNQHRRGSGEPLLLARIVATMHRLYPNIDVRRTYIAGMSSGAFMTVVMATQYPDIFAAAGVASGGEYDPCAPWNDYILADNNLSDPGQSCYQAILNGQGLTDPTASGDLAYRDLVANGGPRAGAPVPVMFMHGTNDSWVAFSEEYGAVRSIARFNDRFSGGGVARNSYTPFANYHTRGQVPGGYLYDVFGADGNTLMWWAISGMPHAWSGGVDEPQSKATNGDTVNDPKGPPATQLFRTFFMRFSK